MPDSYCRWYQKSDLSANRYRWPFWEHQLGDVLICRLGATRVPADCETIDGVQTEVHPFLSNWRPWQTVKDRAGWIWHLLDPRLKQSQVSDAGSSTGSESFYPIFIEHDWRNVDSPLESWELYRADNIPWFLQQFPFGGWVIWVDLGAASSCIWLWYRETTVCLKLVCLYWPTIWNMTSSLKDTSI